jgi:hypothetical protein
MITNEQVQGALRKLGDNSAKIAESLKAMGIRGFLEDSACCPLANYLVKELNLDTEAEVLMIYGGRTVCHGSEYLMYEELPDAAIEFIDRFDAGAFPDLDAEP